jgi:hypothetical protein
VVLKGSATVPFFSNVLLNADCSNFEQHFLSAHDSTTLLKRNVEIDGAAQKALDLDGFLFFVLVLGKFLKHLELFI